MKNTDASVVSGFGDEWSRFNQSGRNADELHATFMKYFSVFPMERLTPDSKGFDLGCGSGRWAQFVAGSVASLTCIDASTEALEVTRQNLQRFSNIEFVNASAGDLPFEDDTFDFGYSLGVLHHTPNPLLGLKDAVRVIRPGGPMLVYLYYALDNRPRWFQLLWRLSDTPRRIISRLPSRGRYLTTQIIAALIYFPLARIAQMLSKSGRQVESIPLSAYRDKPFYVMRTDALDRFGTRIEHRFTRDQVVQLMTAAGLENIEVSQSEPFWCAVGYRANIEDLPGH